MKDDRKVGCYFADANVIAELQAEARRTNRSVSWLAQQAWKIAREKLMQLPAAKE